MDYKEVIERLKKQGSTTTCETKTICNDCKEAATAIETLLAERDAAVEDLRGMCWCCARGKPWEKAAPLSKLTGCEHLSGVGVLSRGGGRCKCPHWEWRGLKKGDGEGG